ncbi:MAG: IS66 family transposase [Candidatus Poribacteria bacterium]|jgi:transposase|nr:IS66 family transposase [Candidatus Poribacteria bacterium]|tara:strand:- start:54 stop:1634 length:1581 start_codon:yes stop_codon:yes gene_type:complete
MSAKPKTSNYTDEQINEIISTNAVLLGKVDSLQSQVDWFKRQIFGSKSEKLRYIDNPHQKDLDELFGENQQAKSKDEGTEEVKGYQRRKKQDKSGTPDDSGLRFDENEVTVQEIEVPCPELAGDDGDTYEVIGTKVTYRLAQKQSSYVVLKYIRKVIKHHPSKKIITPKAPANVLDKCQADVSFLVGLLVDKFLYHQPLYRQHQRLQRSDIELSRTTLTNLVHRAIPLLKPIVDAQLKNILRSHVLAMDETPIKVGGKKKGKMHQAYYWPVYGDQDEMVFTYSASRASKHVREILGDFKGVLLADGYSAYEIYAKSNDNTTLAQCWSHSRRSFEKAKEKEPESVISALKIIARLYDKDQEIKPRWSDQKKLDHRAAHCSPIVDEFFQWCAEQLQRVDLLPSDKFAKALAYVSEREIALREFLTDPAIQLDTNHIERGLRAIPMGRRAWLFCWTEVGAEYVGVIQSLIVTCRLHGINPSVYLTDVFLRIGDHPASRVEELTPRLWKETFADQPLRSDLDLFGNNGSK